MVSKNPLRLYTKTVTRDIFKSVAMNSYGWSSNGLQVFRASQVIFEFSQQANKKYSELFSALLWKDIKTDYDEWVSTQKGPTKLKREIKFEMDSLSPELMVIEEQLRNDGELLHISYTLLARSIELLLKALLIERDENYFFHQDNKGANVLIKRN